MAEWTYRITGIDSRVEFEEGDPTVILEVKFNASGDGFGFPGRVEGHFRASLEDLTKEGIDKDKLREDIHKSIHNIINKYHTQNRMEEQAILYHQEAEKLLGEEFTHQPELRDRNFSTSLPIGFRTEIEGVKEEE